MIKTEWLIMVVIACAYDLSAALHVRVYVRAWLPVFASKDRASPADQRNTSVLECGTTKSFRRTGCAVFLWLCVCVFEVRSIAEGGGVRLRTKHYSAGSHFPDAQENVCVCVCLCV